MTSCSADALDAHEPLAGTAPYATAWIVIEQPGPWGRDALADSRLDRPIAEHLAGHKGTGVSVLLARHQDRPERSGPTDRHVWIARSAAGGMRLRHGVVSSLDEVLGWDLNDIGAGRLPAFGSAVDDPVTFICTHSGRDLCCAVTGRALVTAVMDRLEPDARSNVWECSHIGGHRFAPVSLTLPSGAVHGRLDLDSALAVRRRAAENAVVLDHLRGRSSLLPPFQVAAIEVQRRMSVEDIDDLDVLRVVDGVARPVNAGGVLSEADRQVEAEVRHVDGRSWRLSLVARALERLRLESCGKEPLPGIAWSCVGVSETAGWR